MDLCIIIYVIQVWLKHSSEQRESVGLSFHGRKKPHLLQKAKCPFKLQKVLNNFGLSLKCLVNDSPWTTRQGRSELVLLKCPGCIKKKELNVEPMQERNFSVECCRKLFPGAWAGIMHHNSRYGWNYGPNPATHGPCVLFFFGRTRILYTVITSQMKKLQHKKHIWVASGWATAEPQVHLSYSTHPGLECLQKPFFLLCLWMIKAAWFAILQWISGKSHAWCLHVFVRETTLVCFVKHMLSQKTEEENHITKNSKILFCLEQAILTRLFQWEED